MLIYEYCGSLFYSWNWTVDIEIVIVMLCYMLDNGITNVSQFNILQSMSLPLSSALLLHNYIFSNMCIHRNFLNIMLTICYFVNTRVRSIGGEPGQYMWLWSLWITYGAKYYQDFRYWSVIRIDGSFTNDFYQKIGFLLSTFLSSLQHESKHVVWSAT